jgi:hypothetical protein
MRLTGAELIRFPSQSTLRIGYSENPPSAAQGWMAARRGRRCAPSALALAYLVADTLGRR